MPRTFVATLLALVLTLGIGILPAFAQTVAPVTAQGKTSNEAVQLTQGGRLAGALPAAPSNGSSVSNNGAGLAYYKFDYPGDNSVVTINMQVYPDNDTIVVDQKVGFVVYGPRNATNPGNFYAHSGDQPFKQPNVSGNFQSIEKSTFVIQVYNDNFTPVTYTIWADNLSIQPTATPVVKAPVPAAPVVPATGPVATGAPIKVRLSEENASKIFAEVTLTPMGNQTRVVINATGAGAGPQPAHIHNGTCFNLDPKPLYPLASIVNGVSDTVVDVALSTLQATPMAINVHKSPQEASVYVSCGNIALVRAVGGTGTATSVVSATAVRPAMPAQLPRTGGLDMAALGLIGGLASLIGARIRRAH